jgi:hypothetical protein
MIVLSLRNLSAVLLLFNAFAFQLFALPFPTASALGTQATQSNIMAVPRWAIATQSP